MSKMLFYYN